METHSSIEMPKTSIPKENTELAKLVKEKKIAMRLGLDKAEPKNSMNFQHKISPNGVPLIFADNYEFYKVATSINIAEHVCIWKCRDCKVRLYTDPQITTIISQLHVHNHAKTRPQQLDTVNSSETKEINIDYSNVECIEIIDDSDDDNEVLIIDETHDDVFITTDENCNKKTTPPNAKITETKNDTGTIKESQELLTKHISQGRTPLENHVIVNDIKNSIVIFSNTINLQLLTALKEFYIDETFTSTPKHFESFFVIHAFENNTYTPLVFCLMGKRTYHNYSQTFQHISEKCIDVNRSLVPRKIHFDYGVALSRALKFIFPKTDLVFCKYHLLSILWDITQAWFKQDQLASVFVVPETYFHWVLLYNVIKSLDQHKEVFPDKTKLNTFAVSFVQRFIIEKNDFVVSNMSCESSCEEVAKFRKRFHSDLGLEYANRMHDGRVFVDAVRNINVNLIPS